MYQDLDRCVRAVHSKDARFDGWFYTAVVTTRIYCRPSCPVVPPKVENMRFYPSAAAAQRAGFRACKRCRPDASVGSPLWNQRADVVARAIRMIADGVVDRDGVPGLAAGLGYSTRQLERHLLAEVGAGPLALARAQRAQTARVLIETTTLPISDIAFAAGFTSIRSFNETVRQVFALSPTQLRVAAAKRRPTLSSGMLSLRLPFRAPLAAQALFDRLARSAVPGLEQADPTSYRCSLRLPHGHGVVTLAPAPGHIECQLLLVDLRDLTAAISRCRRLLDLDADPEAVDDVLSADPALAPLVRSQAGRRVARTADGAEFAMRAVLGQGLDPASARRRIVAFASAYGEPIADPIGELTTVFPPAQVVAGLDPDHLDPRPATANALWHMATALADGTLDIGAGCDWHSVGHQLRALPGLSTDTVSVIALRALGDPDVLVAGDPAVRRGAVRAGLPSSARGLAARSAAWRPWRSYAAEYLSAAHPVAGRPASGRAAQIRRAAGPVEHLQRHAVRA